MESGARETRFKLFLKKKWCTLACKTSKVLSDLQPQTKHFDYLKNYYRCGNPTLPNAEAFLRHDVRETSFDWNIMRVLTTRRLGGEFLSDTKVGMEFSARSAADIVGEALTGSVWPDTAQLSEPARCNKRQSRNTCLLDYSLGLYSNNQFNSVVGNLSRTLFNNFN